MQNFCSCVENEDVCPLCRLDLDYTESRTSCALCDSTVSGGETLCYNCRHNEGDYDYDDYCEESFFEAIESFRNSKFNILKAKKMGFTIEEIIDALHEIDGSHPAHHTNWVNFTFN